MKAIPLTKGYFAIVDDSDYDELSKYKWHCEKSRGTLYALRAIKSSDGPTKTERMHRRILGITDATHQADHIDRDGLNNQRSNLRICTHTENVRNRGIFSNNTSGIKGVRFHKIHKKWQARMRFEGKEIHLGYHETSDAAHEAYTCAVKKYHGDFANP